MVTLAPVPVSPIGLVMPLEVRTSPPCWTSTVTLAPDEAMPSDMLLDVVTTPPLVTVTVEPAPTLIASGVLPARRDPGRRP